MRKQWLYIKGDDRNLKRKNQNLTLFLLNKKLTFHRYLTEGLSIKYNLQIDKDYLMENENLTIDSGKIFIIEEMMREPIWADIVNQLKRGKNKIRLEERFNWTVLMFLRFKEIDETLLMTYGRTSGILKDEYIINDFGIETAKQIVDSQKLKSIKIHSFDDRQTQIQKDSIKLLNE